MSDQITGLFAELAKELPDDLSSQPGQMTVVPGVNDFESDTHDENDKPTHGGLLVPDEIKGEPGTGMKLVEFTSVRIRKDAQSVWKPNAELLIGIDGARVGTMNGDKFDPSPAYALPQLEGLTNVPGMLFGQQFSVNENTVDALRAELQERGWVEPVLTNSTVPDDARSKDREVLWRQAAPCPAGVNGTNALRHRIKTGISVRSVVVTSTTDEQYRDRTRRFLDFWTSHVEMLRAILSDSKSKDPDVVRRRRRLWNSLTGIHNDVREFDKQSVRFPIRAGMPVFETDFGVFDFWTRNNDQPQAQGNAAQASEANPEEPFATNK